MIEKICTFNLQKDAAVEIEVICKFNSKTKSFLRYANDSETLKKCITLAALDAAALA